LKLYGHDAHLKGDVEERGLLEAARLGDRRAFEDVLRPLIEPAYRLAFAMLREREAAEDAVQEMALKAWRHRIRIRPELGTIRPWVLAIVANECRLALRARWWSVLRFAELPDQAGSERDPAAGFDLRLALATETGCSYTSISFLICRSPKWHRSLESGSVPRNHAYTA
jgi:RNA polymerase sigma-70 factor (ECF subfamily)